MGKEKVKKSGRAVFRFRGGSCVSFFNLLDEILMKMLSFQPHLIEEMKRTQKNTPGTLIVLDVALAPSISAWISLNCIGAES